MTCRTFSALAVLFRALALAVPLFAFVAAACSRGEGASAKKEGPPGRRGPIAFPVEVAPVAEELVEFSVPAVGSVDAFESVQVTARVAGAVETVRFSEGDVVKKGAVLVEIEPARFQLAVRSAKATLDRVIATRDDAKRGLERRERMLAEGVASAEDVETYRTRLATTAAEVAEARAALALAELNLRDAYVRAPIAGAIQTRSVQTGQYVTVGTVLATLVERDPLLVRFQVPELEAARIEPGMTAKFSVRGVPGEREAEITHVAESADPQSRMIQVVAKAQGETADLRPGAFAEVRVPVGARKPAPVIPQTAVRPTERGFVAFVVEDGKAVERTVELGLRTTSGLVEVKKGVRPGDQLVVRGAEALRDGAPVRPVPPKGPAAPSAAPASPPGATSVEAPGAGPKGAPAPELPPEESR